MSGQNYSGLFSQVRVAVQRLRQICKFPAKERCKVGIFLYVILLSQSNATKCTRELLVKHGFDGSRFTEKSFKVQGVTQLLDSGEPLENVMVFGRWKQTTIPLHYRNLSENFLLSVAGRLPRN